MSNNLTNNLDTLDKNALASTLIDFNATHASGQEFGKDTLHLFVSPLFIKPMQMLFDKNIKTTSCGSGKERGILPGITGKLEFLSSENKAVASSLMISDTEFRIGSEIGDKTTFSEFESKLVAIVELFKAQ